MSHSTGGDKGRSEEGKTIAAELDTNGPEVKSIDLCKRVAEKVANETDTSKRSINKESKVTMASITSYNNNLVAQRPTDKAALRQLHRHERLYKMMEDGAMSKDDALWYYVDHFKGDRSRNIETLSNLVPEKERLQGPRSAEYSKAYLDDYFKGFD